MALRLMELVLPEAAGGEIPALLEARHVLGVWQEKLAEGRVRVNVLLPTEETEAVMDLVGQRFSGAEEFRLILLPVEASLPRPDPPEETPAKEEGGEEPPPERQGGRISREELYQDITGAARITRIFFIMTSLSAVVATIGLIRGDVAVIIGAMVIAPLLGPNMGLSLATSLGDMEMARNSLAATAAGVLTAFLLSCLLGWAMGVRPDAPQIAPRTEVGIGDIALALASGSAGALAFTSGVSATLIGVMVAVSLLPPLVASGMLLGAGHRGPALGAALLFLANVICVNLAGVLTFRIQGIRPSTWWEEERARKATIVSIALWALLLLALAAVILLSRRKGAGP